MSKCGHWSLGQQDFVSARLSLVRSAVGARPSHRLQPTLPSHTSRALGAPASPSWASRLSGHSYLWLSQQTNTAGLMATKLSLKPGEFKAPLGFLPSPVPMSVPGPSGEGQQALHFCSEPSDTCLNPWLQADSG